MKLLPLLFAALLGVVMSMSVYADMSFSGSAGVARTVNNALIPDTNMAMLEVRAQNDILFGAVDYLGKADYSVTEAYQSGKAYVTKTTKGSAWAAGAWGGAHQAMGPVDLSAGAGLMHVDYAVGSENAKGLRLGASASIGDILVSAHAMRLFTDEIPDTTVIGMTVGLLF